MDILDSPQSDIKAGRLYWLYSKRGPGDKAHYAPYRLVNGFVTVPVVGEIAMGLVARGLRAVDASKCRLIGWPDAEPVGGWRPLQGPPEREPEKVVEYKIIEKEVPADAPLVGGLPDISVILELPDSLPDQYRRLFDCYTKTGRLKARHDWP